MALSVGNVFQADHNVSYAIEPTCAGDGSKTSWSSTIPTLTHANGPAHGTSDSDSAADEVFAASVSASCWWSYAYGVKL